MKTKPTCRLSYSQLLQMRQSCIWAIDQAVRDEIAVLQVKYTRILFKLDAAMWRFDGVNNKLGRV